MQYYINGNILTYFLSSFLVWKQFRIQASEGFPTHFTTATQHKVYCQIIFQKQINKFAKNCNSPDNFARYPATE